MVGDLFVCVVMYMRCALASFHAMIHREHCTTQAKREPDMSHVTRKKILFFIVVEFPGLERATFYTFSTAFPNVLSLIQNPCLLTSGGEDRNKLLLLVEQKQVLDANVIAGFPGNCNFKYHCIFPYFSR